LVKEVTKLTMKAEIYPTKETSRAATEAYLEHNHPDFINKFSESRWTGFYDTNVHSKVSLL
jgi:hypothetical protein